MALSLSQFAKKLAPLPKGGGNPAVIRRDVPLARATFFGPGGPQAPKREQPSTPTTVDIRTKGNIV